MPSAKAVRTEPGLLLTESPPLFHLSLASASLFPCNRFVWDGSKELWKKQGSGSTARSLHVSVSCPVAHPTLVVSAESYDSSQKVVMQVRGLFIVNLSLAVGLFLMVIFYSPLTSSL